MALIEVKVPDIGDFKEVEIIELLVKPGDTIAVDQSLLTVESDKASMEIPSSHAGVVKEMKVQLGDKVGEGSLVLVLEAVGAAVTPPSPQPSPAPAGEGAKPPLPPIEGGAKPPLPLAGEGRGEGGASIEVVVPDICDFDEVTVIEVFVKPGDSVRVEQSLITVESDKASMEIPSSNAGVVQSLLVKVGDKVRKGTPVLLLLGTAAAVPAPSPQPSPALAGEGAQPPLPLAGEGRGEGASAPAAMPAHEPTASKGALPHASPSIRRLARELGVPLAEVQGSGPKGRITQVDVQGFVKGVMAGDLRTEAQKSKAPAAAPAATGGGIPGLLAWPVVDFAKFGAVERKPLTRIQKISGANLHRNWVMIPHVTHNDEADITELEAFRVQMNKEHEKAGIKFTMLAFVIKAAVAALQKHSTFNASLDGEELVYKKYFNIGFAADTPNGLVVPVLKNADTKGIVQIAQEMAELSKKARDGKLGPADMTGGTFSISSLGGIGGTAFTPIVNAPEVAILGLSKSAMKPVWDANLNGGAFQPRLILPLSLSYDHRVIDGASGARFAATFAQLLGDFRRVLL